MATTVPTHWDWLLTVQLIYTIEYGFLPLKNGLPNSAKIHNVNDNFAGSFQQLLRVININIKKGKTQLFIVNLKHTQCKKKVMRKTNKLASDLVVTAPVSPASPHWGQ